MKAYVLWPLSVLGPSVSIWFALCAVFGCSPFAWAVWSTAIGVLAAGELVLGVIFERARPQHGGD